MGQYERKRKYSPWRILLTLALGLVSGFLTVKILGWGLVHVGVPGNSAQGSSLELGIMDRFDMQMTNRISSALEGVLSIEKVYWLNDDDQIAPEPNPDNFGTASDPAQLQDFLEEAKQLLGVEDTLFSTETKLYSGSQIT